MILKNYFDEDFPNLSVFITFLPLENWAHHQIIYITLQQVSPCHYSSPVSWIGWSLAAECPCGRFCSPRRSFSRSAHSGTGRPFPSRRHSAP